ncbi:MAG: hypothetical protein HFJ53_02795 [Clostridia bacterium]|jgi:hypothetical protein|nr:hypothetical protein [Clostridia bacterium]
MSIIDKIKETLIIRKINNLPEIKRAEREYKEGKKSYKEYKLLIYEKKAQNKIYKLEDFIEEMQIREITKEEIILNINKMYEIGRITKQQKYEAIEKIQTQEKVKNISSKNKSQQKSKQSDKHIVKFDIKSNATIIKNETDKQQKKILGEKLDEEDIEILKKRIELQLDEKDAKIDNVIFALYYALIQYDMENSTSLAKDYIKSLISQNKADNFNLEFINSDSKNIDNKIPKDEYKQNLIKMRKHSQIAKVPQVMKRKIKGISAVTLALVLGGIIVNEHLASQQTNEQVQNIEFKQKLSNYIKEIRSERKLEKVEKKHEVKDNITTGNIQNNKPIEQNNKSINKVNNNKTIKKANENENKNNKNSYKDTLKTQVKIEHNIQKKEENLHIGIGSRAIIKNKQIFMDSEKAATKNIKSDSVSILKNEEGNSYEIGMVAVVNQQGLYEKVYMEEYTDIKEIDQIQKENPNCKIIVSLQRVEDNEEEQQTGWINYEEVKQEFENYARQNKIETDRDR